MESEENKVPYGDRTNGQDGFFYPTALYAASCRDYDKIVQMLLEKGTDALCVASIGCHDRTVEMLLEKGTNVNTRDGRHLNDSVMAS